MVQLANVNSSDKSLKAHGTDQYCFREFHFLTMLL